MTKRKSFTAEFKREAVRLLDTSKKQPSDLARELGIRRNPLERDVMAMSRTFWGTGTLIFLPPNTPEPLVQTLRQAVRKSFEDPQFHEAYKKLLGVAPTPLMPEEQQKLVADLPRDAEVVKTFSAIADMGSLPPRR